MFKSRIYGLARIDHFTYANVLYYRPYQSRHFYAATESSCCCAHTRSASVIFPGFAKTVNKGISSPSSAIFQTWSWEASLIEVAVWLSQTRSIAQWTSSRSCSVKKSLFAGVLEMYSFFRFPKREASRIVTIPSSSNSRRTGRIGAGTGPNCRLMYLTLVIDSPRSWNARRSESQRTGNNRLG